MSAYGRGGAKGADVQNYGDFLDVRRCMRTFAYHTDVHIQYADLRERERESKDTIRLSYLSNFS